MKSGSTPKRNQKDFWVGGDIPWFTVKDIREQGREIGWTLESVTQKALDETSLNVVPAGSILLCCTASVGEYAFTRIPVSFNQQFNGLIPTNDVASRFLMFWCSTLKKELLSLSGKATVDFVSQSKLKNIMMPIPPLEEQQRIVELLDEVFEAIDKAKANIERNLANARELFQSRLNEIFANPSEDWEVKPLGEVCSIVADLVDPRLDKYSNMVHVGGSNIESETGKLVGLRTSEQEGLKSGKFPFNDKDVLYNKIRPYLVKVARPQFEGICSADMYPLRPNEGMSRDFLFYLLTTEKFTAYAISVSARAGMPKVNRKDLFKYESAFPPRPAQNQMVNELDTLSVRVRELEKKTQLELDNLEELRQSVLEQAFEGKLTDSFVS